MPTVEYKPKTTVYTVATSPEESWNPNSYRQELIQRLLVLDPNPAIVHGSHTVIVDPERGVAWKLDVLQNMDICHLQLFTSLMERLSEAANK